MKATNPGMTCRQIVANVDHQMHVTFNADGLSQPAGYAYAYQIDRNEAKKAVADYAAKQRKAIRSDLTTEFHIIPESLLMFEHIDVSLTWILLS